MKKGIIVNDANILIDLISIDLLSGFFQLEQYELTMTDFVFEELYPEQKQLFPEYILNGTFRIINSDLEEVSIIAEIFFTTNGLSFPDCSVLYHTKKISGILLTGDGKLRKKSIESGIEVHGILYVLDLLVFQNVIQKSVAIEKLKMLSSKNKRLPKNEIEKRIAEWEK